MSSPAQVLSNQQNAQSSTGPRTEEGKAVSCLNALVHGVYSDSLRFSSPEKQAAFEALLSGFVTCYQPIDEREEDCVYRIAKARWHQASEERQMTAYLIQLETRIVAELTKEGLDPSLHLDGRLYEAKAVDKTLRAGLRRARELRSDANRALRELNAVQDERKSKAREDARRKQMEQKRRQEIALNQWESQILNEMRASFPEGLDLPSFLDDSAEIGFVPASPPDHE